MKRIVVAFLFVLASCAPIEAPTGDDDDDDDDDTPEKVYEPIEGGSFTVGEDARPVTVFVPDAYDPDVAMPFVLLLHGYGLSGEQMDGALGFAAFAEASSFIYASPTGLIDSSGGYFWNATDACCDFEGTNVDDSSFLRAIVDDAAEIAHIDPARTRPSTTSHPPRSPQPRRHPRDRTRVAVP
jgi:poly(3-hydroxybutyrate) depolymerase